MNEESARRIELHNECLRALPKKLSPTHSEMKRPVKCIKTGCFFNLFIKNLDYSDDSAAETDDSDVEESVKFDSKIIQEQKKFTARQQDEDANMRLLEAKRIWLIKNIERFELLEEQIDVSRESLNYLH